MSVSPLVRKPWSAIQRPATDLGTTPQGKLHLDGVRWDIANNPDGTTQELGIFGEAYIQPEEVQDVYLGINPFTDKPKGYPGHAQLHFEFRPQGPVVDGQQQQDHGLVISVEPRFYQGEPWQPGGQEPQPTLYQVCTWSNAVEKATVHHHYPIHLYKLLLNQEQKQALLRERLQAATADHSQDVYHPVTNSCISTLIDGVNRVVPEHQRIPHSDPNSTVPVWSPKAFKKYHLIASTQPDLVIAAQPKA